jgi:type I restriction enzyme S subunit
MCEWKECNLGQFINVKHGFAFKGTNIVVEPTKDILVTPGNFYIGGGFKSSKFKYFNGEYPIEYMLKENDIIVTMTDLSKGGDTLGYSAKVPRSNGKNYLHNQRIGLVQFLSNEVDRNFIYWLMRTKDYQRFIVGAASGTSIRHTSPTTIKEYQFLKPSFPEQRAIASVLSSLDDKIDLLHRQNKTLEAMAETLFRQWFVEEADEGWEEKPLSSVANFLNGLACQKYPPENDIDKLPVLKIKELRNGFTKDFDWATTDVKPEYIVENGDVIFSWSASLMVKMWDGEKCILNQHLFKVTSKDYPKWFYYQWCKHYLDEFVSISTSHATTMGHIKRGDLDVAMVLVPSKKELEEMTIIMDSLIEKLIKITKQIRTLEKLRDTLLPKLMSGEVRVEYE